MVRAQAGYSQKEAARRMRTPLRTLQDWESGRRRVPGLALVVVELLAEKEEKTMEIVKRQISQRLDGAAINPEGEKGNNNGETIG